MQRIDQAYYCLATGFTMLFLGFSPAEAGDGNQIVEQAMAQIELSEESRAKVTEVFATISEAWSEWDRTYRQSLAEYQRKIAALKKSGLREEIKAAEAARDKILDQRPSLLRDDTPLKAVLSQEEYQRFKEALGKLTA